MERLVDKLIDYLKTSEGREVNLRDIRMFLRIEPGSKDDTNLRTQMSTTMVERKVVKPSGRSDGVYKVLTPVKAITTMADIDEIPIGGFRFPRNHGEDDTAFGIEDLVEVFEGDLILITGRSNYGKTAMALNIMGENLLLMPTVLMGSEYTASNGKLSPKFKRRIKRMAWANLANEDGTLNFKLLPIGGDYEDYVEADCMNVIDWISLDGEYYLIDRVERSIKDMVGRGVAVVVLQKNKDNEFAEGGERTVRYADVVLNIDAYGENESLLTIGKVKAPRKRATGRTWAFEVIDFGANFLNIREVVKCRICWGKKWKKFGNTSVPCDDCHRTGYVDL